MTHWSLLVSFYHTLHSVSAALVSPFGGGGGVRCPKDFQWHTDLEFTVTNLVQMEGEDYNTSRYLPTVGVLVTRWYSCQRPRFRKSM